jgi:hypothetical protein
LDFAHNEPGDSLDDYFYASAAKRRRDSSAQRDIVSLGIESRIEEEALVPYGQPFLEKASSQPSKPESRRKSIDEKLEHIATKISCILERKSPSR